VHQTTTVSVSFLSGLSVVRRKELATYLEVLRIRKSYGSVSKSNQANLSELASGRKST